LPNCNSIVTNSSEFSAGLHADSTDSDGSVNNVCDVFEENTFDACNLRRTRITK